MNGELNGTWDNDGSTVDDLMEELKRDYILYPCSECRDQILLQKSWTIEQKAKRVGDHHLNHFLRKRPFVEFSK